MEEENRSLRKELKGYVSTRQQLMRLEKELRSSRDKCERYKVEVSRLQETEAKLRQVCDAVLQGGGFPVAGDRS